VVVSYSHGKIKALADSSREGGLKSKAKRSGTVSTSRLVHPVGIGPWIDLMTRAAPGTKRRCAWQGVTTGWQPPQPTRPRHAEIREPPSGDQPRFQKPLSGGKSAFALSLHLSVGDQKGRVRMVARKAKGFQKPFASHPAMPSAQMNLAFNCAKAVHCTRTMEKAVSGRGQRCNAEAPEGPDHRRMGPMACRHLRECWAHRRNGLGVMSIGTQNPYNMIRARWTV